MHRNSQKRQYQENKAYFITCNVKDKRDFFKESLFCELFIEELKLVKKLKQFKLHAFCLNHNHFHILITPSQEFDISKIMFSLKKQFSHDVNRILGFNEINTDNLKAPKRLGAFKLNNTLLKNKIIRIQRFVVDLKNKFTHKYGAKHNISKFQWQKSFHNHIIRGEKDFKHHHHYTQYNFLKHELSENWQYTSLNYSGMIEDEIIW